MSEKDRQVIKTTSARLWSRAWQRLVETDHILFLPSKQSRLHRKTTKRDDHNGKTEIGVAAERNKAVNQHFFFQVMGTCFCGNFHLNSLFEDRKKHLSYILQKLKIFSKKRQKNNFKFLTACSVTHKLFVTSRYV